MDSIETTSYSDSDRLSAELKLGDCPRGSMSLRYSYAVLDRIRKEVFKKFVSIPRGGVEVGGVLFGAISECEIRILDSRALEIEYLNGPSFILSENDETSLLQLLETAASDPDLRGMQPVGWYHSHTRSEIVLSEEDIAVHQRFFQNPENIALVIKPYKFDPPRIGVFLRTADGSLSGDAPRSTFSLEPAGKNNSGAEAPAMASVDRTAPSADPVSEWGQTRIPARSESPDYRSPESGLREFPIGEPLSTSHPLPANRSIWIILTVAITAICIAGLLLVDNNRPQPVRESAPMWLRLSDAGDHLDIVWDRSSPVFANARSAEIVIAEAGRQPATVPLDRDSLRRGTVSYVRRSGDVEVLMRVRLQDDRVREEIVRFITPELAPQLAATPDAVPGAKREPPDLDVLQMKAEMERLKKELNRVQPEGVRTRYVPEPRSVPGPEVSGRNEVVTRPVDGPVSPGPSAPAETVAELRPPTLDTQSVASAPIAPAPPLQIPSGIQPPQPASGRQQVAVAPRPASGRAIWTGRLPKGGLLLFDGRRPSVGTLNGPFPQKASRFRVFVAELGDSGIVVFSGDARQNAVEPPSPANGWNLTTYNADPKRSRSISVLEYPVQQNGWKRLLIRSEDRPVSMLVIDWEELSGN